MLSVGAILQIVHEELGVSLEEMRGPKQNHVIDARNITAMLMLEEGYTGSRVTGLFRRDRTTMYNIKRAFNAHIENDKQFKVKYLTCIKRIIEIEENEN